MPSSAALDRRRLRLRGLGLLVAPLLAAACGRSTDARPDPQAGQAARATSDPGGAATAAAASATVQPRPERARPRPPWVSRCLLDGERAVEWSPAQLVAARAVAQLAVEGSVEPPTVPAPSHAPAAAFEVAWSLARATRLLGQDAQPALDHAISAAEAIKDEHRRGAALVMGALELRASGEREAAARWARAVTGPDQRLELLAHGLRLDAESGDFTAALAAVRKLPPTWALLVEPRDWEGYPASVGSAAAAVCFALASPRVAAAPEARALVEEAQQGASKIDEDWRRNRAWRALAIAWSRLGEPDRALSATERMPGGSERSDTIAAVLGEVGRGVPSAQLTALANHALRSSALGKSPPVLVGSTQDADGLRAFVQQAEAGVVASGLARAYFDRGSLREGRSVVESIPAELAVRSRASGYEACALEAAGQHAAALQALASSRPRDEAYLDTFFQGLAEAGCPALARAAVEAGPIAGRRLTSFVERLVRLDLVDDALALHEAHRDRSLPSEQVEQLGWVTVGLGRASRWEDAAALVERTPAMPFPLLDARVATWGLRLVPALVAGGHRDRAARLRDALGRRIPAEGTSP